MEGVIAQSADIYWEAPFYVLLQTGMEHCTHT